MEPRPPADALRALPSVDRVLHFPDLAQVATRFEREPLVRMIRETLEAYRREIAAGSPAPTLYDISKRVRDVIASRWEAGYRPVINATGVILHTNLGRAPLAEEAIGAVTAATAYNDLEIDLRSGARASRQDRVAAMLRDLTGAPAALVVSNNAAAVTLALAALARGRRVIVSRGQAVEIGGGFRVPAIMRQSGARLVEVGTTNRTRIEDYEEALTPGSAAILHVHPSNFRIIGFTEDVPLRQLATLAKREGTLLISDNGSGPLVDTHDFGLAHEPTPIEALEAGSDIICFSADKLLGGPQAGIILGRSEIVRKLARHPLARAVRPDKLCLAALAATLRLYLEGRRTEIPVIRMLAWTLADLQERARAWSVAAAARGLQVHIEQGESTVGGGSLPGETLPTVLLTLPASVDGEQLRIGTPPVVTRTRGNRALLDLRTVAPSDDIALLDAVCRAADTVVEWPTDD